MSRAIVILDSPANREKVADWARRLPFGSRVEFKKPKRSLDQNSLMWVLLTLIAQHCTHHGIKLSADDWKLLFLDALKREVRMVPNLDGNGFVSLGRSSSDLSIDEMSDLIELIYAYGARESAARVLEGRAPLLLEAPRSAAA